jgi:hypothetical protein
VPSEYGEQLGVCGGGAYRQIEVYIDGMPAGFTYPFPVLYTGGINPLLWRPLTGIYSFNIPPYSFDLTPFAGVLNDGKEHVFGVRVLGNNPEGSWFVDPVLRLNFAQPNVPAENAQMLPGEILDISGPATSVEVTKEEGHLPLLLANAAEAPDAGLTNQQAKSADASITFVTVGSASFSVTGSVGEAVNTVSNTLSASNTNSVGTTRGVTVGKMESVSTSSNDETHTVNRVYPYNIISSYDQTSTDFEIFGFVDFADIVNITSSVASEPPVAWELHMTTNATYNRTNDYVYNKDTDTALERFTAGNGVAMCSKQTLAATDGYVVAADESDTCEPEQQQRQQDLLCGHFDVCAPVSANLTASSSRSLPEKDQFLGPVLFRSPWRHDEGPL